MPFSHAERYVPFVSIAYTTFKRNNTQDTGTTFRKRVQSMQRIMREAGGYQRTADAIIQFVQARAKVH